MRNEPGSEMANVGGKCAWSYNLGYGEYLASCGKTMPDVEYLSIDDEFSFCPFCGKPISFGEFTR